MTKILNLDKLAQKESRQLQLKGVTYEVREMSVEDFIESSLVAEKLENELSMAVQMRESIKLIQRAVPDIATDALTGLNIEQLSAVSKFVRGVEVEEIETVGDKPGDKTEPAEGEATPGNA